jgi:hypothetical protein
MKLATEVGVKLRFKAEVTPFLGVKLGVRALNLERPGFVVEVGPGPF